jgi:two-component system, cell cycle sensor histidine kinase and response regulator CckA
VSATRAGSHRVLLVDDEPSVRRFASRVLTEEGYLVEEAIDGAEALDRLRNGGPPVDVVVSDVVMPRLNGVELALALSGLHPTLPVILMSGYATGQLEGMGIATPCGILGKPFSGERLIKEVRRCLKDADPLAFPVSDGSGRA